MQYILILNSQIHEIYCISYIKIVKHDLKAQYQPLNEVISAVLIHKYCLNVYLIPSRIFFLQKQLYHLVFLLFLSISNYFQFSFALFIIPIHHLRTSSWIVCPALRCVTCVVLSAAVYLHSILTPCLCPPSLSFHGLPNVFVSVLCLPSDCFLP